MPRFVHAAIVEWYGGAEAFTEYVRGPLQEELVSKQRTGVQISYCMMLVTPFLSVALCPLEVFVRMCVMLYGAVHVQVLLHQTSLNFKHLQTIDISSNH